MPGVDSDLIKHALNVARERGYAEVEIETATGRFAAALEKAKQKPKNPSPVTTHPSPEKAASNGVMDVKAPLVGYYNQADLALEPGKTVSKGDVVAVITALGLANDVESPQTGEVVEVLVSDGDPVQYGQVLARVKVKS